MIKPEQVPKSVWKAALRACEEHDGAMQEVVAAALNAWPGMIVMPENSDEHLSAHIRLPLTQEKTDDQ